MLAGLLSAAFLSLASLSTPVGGSSCGQGSFPTSAAGFQCYGLLYFPSGQASADACASACCSNPYCSVWQWSTADGCWAGDLPPSSCGSPGSAPQWHGGRRLLPSSLPPGLSPAPSSSAVLPSMPGSSRSPPQTCFDDGTCVTLTNYIMDDTTRSGIVSQCSAGSADEVCKYLEALPCCSYSDPGSKANFDPATYARYGPDLKMVSVYTWGLFMGGTDSYLRSQQGQNIKSSYKNAFLLLSSGINLLNQNATVQKYIEDDGRYLFRGEPTFPGAYCAVNPKAATVQGADASSAERTLYAWTSWSRSWLFAINWAVLGQNWAAHSPKHAKLLVLYRRNLQDGNGAYIMPAGIPEQLEYTLEPGFRVRSLACEQFSYTVQGQTVTVAVEYLYDVTVQGPASVQDEGVMLQRMRMQLQRQADMCWPTICGCGTASGADVYTPVDGMKCVRNHQLAAASGDEHAVRTAPRGSPTVAIVVGSLAACAAALALGTLVVVMRRRRYRSMQGLEMSAVDHASPRQ